MQIQKPKSLKTNQTYQVDDGPDFSCYDRSLTLIFQPFLSCNVWNLDSFIRKRKWIPPFLWKFKISKMYMFVIWVQLPNNFQIPDIKQKAKNKNGHSVLNSLRDATDENMIFIRGPSKRNQSRFWCRKCSSIQRKASNHKFNLVYQIMTDRASSIFPNTALLAFYHYYLHHTQRPIILQPIICFHFWF